MGAAWRNPRDRDMDAVVEMVRGVRAMGLETCMTLGWRLRLMEKRTLSATGRSGMPCVMIGCEREQSKRSAFPPKRC
jgi:hypothetical protein